VKQEKIDIGRKEKAGIHVFVAVT